MTAGGRTLRADAARNRELVLDAAARLLRERGLDVTVQEIADEAGVGVGTVMRRFRGKDELIAALVDARMEALLEIVQRGIERVDHEPWSAFSAAFTDAVELHVRDRGFMEAVGGSRCQQQHPRHVELRSEVMAQLEALVQRAIAAGAVRADLVAEDIPELACMVSRTSCMPGSELDPDSWRRACAIVVDGMRAPRDR